MVSTISRGPKYVNIADLNRLVDVVRLFQTCSLAATAPRGRANV
jgi:hypothetical protein